MGSVFCVALMMVWAQSAMALVGSGSTVLCSTLEKIADDNKSALSSYDCIGSGRGKDRLFSTASVSFAASDSVLDETQIANHPDAQMVPFTVTPIGVIYNLPSIRTLVLSRTALASIFSGSIRYWDDAVIALENPDVTFPHEPIVPVVRGDKSGSTEIFTRALNSFSSTIWRLGVISTWPSGTTAVTKVGGSNVLSHVQSTPYTISYSGMSDVTSNGISFAVVKNKVGSSTLPGWADGDETADSFVFNNETLVADMREGLGYPITGVSYIIIRKNAPNICEILNWLHWLLTDPSVDVIISRSGLVPSAVSTRNMAFTRLASPKCESLLQKPVRVHVHGEEDARLLNKIGYGLNADTPQKYLQMVYDDSDVTVNLKDPGYLSFPVALEGVEVVVNFGINIAVMELDMKYLRQVFTKEIRFWNNSNLRVRSSYVPSSDASIEVVTDEGMAYYGMILGALGIDNANAPLAKPDKILKDLVSVADYVKGKPNTIAVLPSVLSASWKLSLVQPVVNNSPTSSYKSVLSNTNLLAYTTDSFTVTINSSTQHPFFRVISFEVNSNVVNLAGCERGHYDLVTYLLGVKGQETIKNDGLLLLTSVIEDLKVHQLPRLQCNGNRIMYKPSEFDKTLLVVLGSIVGGILCVVIVCLVFHYLSEKKKHQNLLNENIYAAQSISEALVIFDLDAARRALSQCTNLPETLQKAFTSLIANLDSYKAYLPDSCLHGNSEEDLFSATQSETDEFAFTPGSRIRASSGSSSTHSLQNTAGTGGSFVQNSPNTRKRRSLKVDLLLVRKITMAVINVVRFHRADDMSDLLIRYLHLITKVTADYNGIRDGFSGDKMNLSWNGAKGNMNHVYNAGKACKVIQGLCEKEDIITTVGLSSGPVKCGVVGTERVKKFTIIGGVVGWVCMLERLNALYKTSILTDASDVRNFYYTYTVDMVVFPKYKSDTHIRIYAISSEKEVDNSEWMYQLQEANSNDPHRDFNKAMDSYFSGDYTAAKALLVHISEPSRAPQVLEVINGLSDLSKLPQPTTMLGFKHF